MVMKVPSTHLASVLIISKRKQENSVPVEKLGRITQKLEVSTVQLLLLAGSECNIMPLPCTSSLP